MGRNGGCLFDRSMEILIPYVPKFGRRHCSERHVPKVGNRVEWWFDLVPKLCNPLPYHQVSTGFRLFRTWLLKALVLKSVSDSQLDRIPR